MVTLSERGVCFYAPDHSQGFQRIPAFEREITDVSGAGDAVIAVASCCSPWTFPSGKSRRSLTWPEAGV